MPPPASACRHDAITLGFTKSSPPRVFPMLASALMLRYRFRRSGDADVTFSRQRLLPPAPPFSPLLRAARRGDDAPDASAFIAQRVARRRAARRVDYAATPSIIDFPLCFCRRRLIARFCERLCATRRAVRSHAF